MNELTPYLCVADARAAVEWYVDVLGAEVTYAPIEMPDGRIGHVELAVKGAPWMMSEEFAEANVAPPDPSRATRSRFTSLSRTSMRWPPVSRLRE